ncbi:DUF192 domain-containing protein [Cohnella candidum]|uniref:DUF192 domain-containing protein n=1 Tax=Cohnella candidum TaxID=2674991 RepID=A0A3G3K4B2_9BACL|nr:DUF192 domain-containing protein [Cohnella candidum]AYQ75001.1 DUF192 domain-containing protein [Cohnella candidum]
MMLVIRETGRQLGLRIEKADTFFRRFRGLMLTPSLSEGSGLHIQPCRAVHSFFMKYPVDVLHLDAEGKIVGMEHGLKPGNIGISFRKTRSVVELPAGTLTREEVQLGHTAIFEELSDLSIT